MHLDYTLIVLKIENFDKSATEMRRFLLPAVEITSRQREHHSVFLIMSSLKVV